jgi:hypothetical protein
MASNEFITLISDRLPGKVSETTEYFIVRHGSQFTSTLWKRYSDVEVPEPLGKIGFYRELDGADLFSGAFKIAAIARPKQIHGVEIAPSLAGLADEARAERLVLRGGAIPFMRHSAGWLYTTDEGSGIVEWDLRHRGVRARCASLEEILRGWFEAVAAKP